MGEGAGIILLWKTSFWPTMQGGWRWCLTIKTVALVADQKTKPWGRWLFSKTKPNYAFLAREVDLTRNLNRYIIARITFLRSLLRQLETSSGCARSSCDELGWAGLSWPSWIRPFLDSAILDLVTWILPSWIRILPSWILPSWICASWIRPSLIRPPWIGHLAFAIFDFFCVESVNLSINYTKNMFGELKRIVSALFSNIFCCCLCLYQNNCQFWQSAAVASYK